MRKRRYMHGKRRRRSPLLKDIKVWEGSGEQINIDDSNLGEEYLDEHGNKARDHKKTGDVFYTKPPRFEGPKEPKMPITKNPVT
tara:strand:+ start:91 stop:342 length:252 start_codon:yes stop_codon:yes gene_type:complete